ncbi:cytochrome C [Anaeromyxobacter paludicola]|uniref:Cytochrome c n=1 Tax=Anaeromyxobacter paludicola TaxID=2918171 RepID=A0ABN6NB57_9BACT|nr:cytochrome C [Anaeromyxobacter paludicola]BDG09255.1 cytochrome c [Anaeromyxobacter paludicola]
MKSFRFALALVATIAAGNAWAFHDGGVAYCDGCHSMHNSSGNKSMSGGRNTGLTGWNSGGKASTVQFQGNNYLLQGSDNSSTCLNCHAAADTAPSSYHVMTFPAPAAGSAPVERTPGGDFAWLTQTYKGTASYGAPVTSKGERHGHNVVAQDYGLVADATLTTAPGGNYPAASLSCASCHDPHSRARITDVNGTITNTAFGSATLPIGGPGSYGAAPTADEAVGVYRLLAPSNYSQMSVPGVMAFNANPPVAVAPATYNRTEAVTETRVAYGAGMSEWCSNCHRSIHNDNVNAANTALIHPAGNGAKLTATANNLAGAANGTTIAAIYNAYKKSGDLTGTSAGSYTSLVPYEEGTTVIATLAGHAVNDGTQTGGPSLGSENVSCLSCHRAHAGGFDSMTRWNNKAEFLTLGGQWPGSDSPVAEGAYGQYSMGMNQATYQAAMYDRPATNFAFAQRSLCNKCHAKD